jgi:hypothetical protein
MLSKLPLLLIAFIVWPHRCLSEETPDDAQRSEHAVLETFDPLGRLLVNSPAAADTSATAVRMLVYALPNGNTIEQTLGCKMAPGLDWHYDIQHVGAQVRMLRELNPDERLVLVCAEADGLSWPTWRKSRNDGNTLIGRFLHDWRSRYGGAEAKVTLTGHSGGGSFIFGMIQARSTISPTTLTALRFSTQIMRSNAKSMPRSSFAG